MAKHTYPHCPASTGLSEDCVCGMITGGSGTLDDPFRLTAPGTGPEGPVARSDGRAFGRCSPARPCAALNETHVDMWGECFVSSYERIVSLGAEVPSGQIVEAVAKQPPGTPPSTIEFFEVDAEGRRLYLTCWTCGHSMDREHPCHHCGSKLIRQGGHSLQPWCGCRQDAART